MTTSSLGKLQTELNDVSRELQAAREEIAQLKMKEKRQQSQLIACLKELARLRQSGELVENVNLHGFRWTPALICPTGTAREGET